MTPTVVPCTLTETVHVALAASVGADRLTELAPAVAVTEPPQVLIALGVAATTRPLGKLSVNATLVKPTVELGYGWRTSG